MLVNSVILSESGCPNWLREEPGLSNMHISHQLLGENELGSH